MKSNNLLNKIRFISFLLIIFIGFSSLYAKADNGESFVKRLYENLLNRQGDDEGVNYWTNLLKNNSNATNIAKEFFRSQEFIDSNVSNSDYIKKLYLTLLDRTPDKEGFEYWLKMLDEKRVKRDQIFYSFAFSREFALLSIKYQIRASDQKEKIYSFIERFYNLILDRIPSPSEVEYWYQKLQDGEITTKEVAGGFLYSKEFLDKETDNETFVTVLYQAIMNRAAESEGLEFWVNKLNTKEMNRQQVIENFLDSNEYEKLSNSYLKEENILENKGDLNLGIKSFELTDKNSKRFKSYSKEITLLPNEGQYIFIDLATKEIHRFKHYSHDGGILLGFVKTDDKSIEKIIPIDPAFPKSGIENFQKKMFSGEKATVAIIGDSLFRPDTGSGNEWMARLFDQNNENKQYLLPPNVTYKNFSVGGETAMWGVAQVSLSVLTSGFMEGGVVSSTRNAEFTEKYFKDTDPKKEKPADFDSLLKDNYDLYIIGLGVNTGMDYDSPESIYSKEFYEILIRRLIKEGKEVLIVTESNNKKIHNYHEDVVDWQIELADKYGCSLCNSWDYTYEAAKEGKNIWVEDTIHMNDEGHELYANAIFSTLYSFNGEAKTRGLEKVFIDENFPTAMELIFYTPLITDEVKYSDYILTDGAENLYPPHRHGYDKLCEIMEGESATYIHPYCKGAALLIQVKHPFRAEVVDENGKVVKKIELKEENVSFHTIPILVPLDMKESYGSHAWRVNVLSGTMRIYGLGALTRDLKEIGFEDTQKIGSGWSEEENKSSVYEFPKVLYTDNTGDELKISYTGKALNLLLAEGKSGGIIEIYEDGKLTKSVDLYKYRGESYYQDNLIKSFVIGDPKRESTAHTVTIKLTGKSEYANTPTTNSHRVMIYDINAITD